jgi:hypothetical protein
MISVRHTSHSSARFLPLVTFLALILCGCQGTRVEAMQTLKKLPSLEQALKMSESRYSGEKPSQSDVTFEIKQNYDLILARREQLEISNEVKGHFEKAVTQAEKKFEEGEGDVSQSAVTKLKLGLAGTLNDISQFNSDIALAQLHLEKHLGVQWAKQVDISDPKFQPVEFPHQTADEFLKSNTSGKAPEGSDLYDLREAVIKVNKAREQLALARKNRKMTRALLVTEAANYDFGIGNEADLFEALMIYTRVLVGYFEAMHTFNVAVYRVHSRYHAK